MDITSKTTSENISKQINDILNLEEELKNITGSLDSNYNDINAYNNRGFLGKVFNSKEIKWENHANDVYKGLDLNFRLNKNNTLVIISIFKLLLEQEKKIKDNLFYIDDITKKTNEGFTDYEKKIKQLIQFQNEIKKDKEETIEQVNSIIEKLNNDDEVSKELANVLVNTFTPNIKGNKENIQNNLNEINNTKKEIRGIDEYILKLEKDILETKNEHKKFEKDIYSSMENFNKSINQDIDKYSSQLKNDILETKSEHKKFEKDIYSSMENFNKSINEGVDKYSSQLKNEIFAIKEQYSSLEKKYSSLKKLFFLNLILIIILGSGMIYLIR